MYVFFSRTSYISYVTLAKSLSFSKPQVPHLSNVAVNHTQVSKKTRGQIYKHSSEETQFTIRINRKVLGIMGDCKCSDRI